MDVKPTQPVRVRVKDEFGPHPWDKDRALRLQEKKLVPAVREGKTIVYDFADVQTLSQSFAGALVGELKQEFGADFERHVRFENTNSVIDSVLSLAMAV